MFRTPMTLDRTHKNLTLACCALVAAVSVLVVVSRQPVGMLIAALIVVVLAIAWAFAPTAVVVGDRDFLIERRAWRPLRIPLASIEHAETIVRTRRGLRLFGVGGFFGTYGLYWSEVLGRHRMYATRAGGIMVVVRRRDGLPILVTPDDSAGTLAAFAVHGA
jgi:Mn2+/Fe2+ NRAMP family transporter